jgi:hypothetical protein
MQLAISDESGTQHGNLCYGIGALVLEKTQYPRIDQGVREIFAQHSVLHELKWSQSLSRRNIEAACMAIDYVLHHGCRFHTIIVEKERFANIRRRGHEKAFYQTYGFLIDHIGKRSMIDFELWMDERSDSYSRNPEVLQIITNHRSQQRGNVGRLVEVRMIKSESNALLQLTDLLTGAITADTHRRLGGDERPLRPGKQELVERFATLIGWDRLCYDTFPNAKFDVWHFPEETRGPTRRLAQWLEAAA